MKFLKKSPDYLKKKLEKTPLFIKVVFLMLMGVVFFFGDLLISEQDLVIYFCFLSIIFLTVGYISKLVLGRQVFFLTIKLWSLTALLYFLIVVPLTFNGISVSPLIELHDESTRWLYNLSYPFRLLGILFSGLTFIEIISPIEFLRYGQIGLYIALFFRIIEYGKQTFFDTIDVLRMNGEWPEDRSRIRLIMRIILYAGPTLVIVTFRNILLFFIPWGWINFDQIKNNIKGELK